MKKKNQRFTETKGEKFAIWLKEKRFYIVLLCCIMAVSATYFMVDTFQKAPVPSRQQGNIVKVSPTPLPDLTKNFPADDKESKATTTPVVSKVPSKSENKSAASVKPTEQPSASTANADAEIDYNTRDMATLSFPVSGEIITPHTEENLIYSKTLADWRSHDGIDIKATIGTDVKAADDGIIEDVYTDDTMGITIVIDHLNGRKSIYSNLSNSSFVKKGQNVRRGDIINAVGDTAIFETAEVGHLHFEVSDNGKPIDPLTVLEK